MVYGKKVGTELGSKFKGQRGISPKVTIWGLNSSLAPGARLGNKAWKHPGAWTRCIDMVSEDLEVKGRRGHSSERSRERKCSMCGPQNRFHDLFAVNYYFKSIYLFDLHTYLIVCLFLCHGTRGV